MRIFALAAAVAATSCACPAARPAPELSSRALEAGAQAERLAIGDLSGDGHVEIVYASGERLWVVDRDGRELARIGAPGGIHVLETADLDGDGRDVILAGWGISREHLEAPPRMSLYRLRGGDLFEDSLPGPETTSRSQIEAILPIPAGDEPTLLLAYRISTYVVRALRAIRGPDSWDVERIDSIYMATSYGVGDFDGSGRPDLVVGRVYGEAGGDGDAFALRPDASRISIPTKRGVRALAVADLDGDGRDAILLADGWDRNYGEIAEARLTLARWDGSRFRTELIDEDPDQYTFWDIVAADFTGDGSIDIVTRGDRWIRLLSRDSDGWSGRRVAAGCLDIAASSRLRAGPTYDLLALCDDGAVLHTAASTFGR